MSRFYRVYTVELEGYDGIDTDLLFRFIRNFSWNIEVGLNDYLPGSKFFLSIHKLENIGKSLKIDIKVRLETAPQHEDGSVEKAEKLLERWGMIINTKKLFDANYDLTPRSISENNIHIRNSPDYISRKYTNMRWE